MENRVVNSLEELLNTDVDLVPEVESEINGDTTQTPQTPQTPQKTNQPQNELLEKLYSLRESNAHSIEQEKKNDEMLIDQYLKSKKEFLEIKTEELVKAIIALEQEKKAIDEEIRMVKHLAKEDGVDVNKVSKVVTRLKTKLRAKPEDIAEEDKIEDFILSHQDILSDLKDLIAPLPPLPPAGSGSMGE